MSGAKAKSFSGPNRTGQTQVNLVPVGRRVLRVARVEDITPRYRRIVFAGEDLEPGFPFVRFAPTDHVKLFFPQPETGQLVVPTVTDQGWVLPEGAAQPIYRDYTVRAVSDEGLTIDFVVHAHGVAGQWARDARPGAELGVLGPRGNVFFPENYGRYIAAGDETALPAISRLLEELPAHARAIAIIEVADADEVQVLHVPEGSELNWVCRDSADVAEGDHSALETALRRVSIADRDDVFVFAAGETTKLKPIRRYLRRELGLPKEQIEVDGYWKTGVANLDHHSNELTDDDT